MFGISPIISTSRVWLLKLHMTQRITFDVSPKPLKWCNQINKAIILMKVLNFRWITGREYWSLEESRNLTRKLSRLNPILSCLCWITLTSTPKLQLTISSQLSFKIKEWHKLRREQNWKVKQINNTLTWTKPRRISTKSDALSVAALTLSSSSNKKERKYVLTAGSFNKWAS